MTPYEGLCARLGADTINAYAVEHGIDKSDPGWAGAIQMIPLLDAMSSERARIESVAADVQKTLDSIASAQRELLTATSELRSVTRVIERHYGAGLEAIDALEGKGWFAGWFGDWSLAIGCVVGFIFGWFAR